jgi:hypothetical protein
MPTELRQRCEVLLTGYGCSDNEVLSKKEVEVSKLGYGVWDLLQHLAQAKNLSPEEYRIFGAMDARLAEVTCEVDKQGIICKDKNGRPNNLGCRNDYNLAEVLPDLVRLQLRVRG